MVCCRRSLLHDAVLVLDRVMSSAVQLRPDMYLTALCAALLLVARQPDPSGLRRTHSSTPPPLAPVLPGSPAHAPSLPPPAVASALSALPGGQGAAGSGWNGPKGKGDADKREAALSPEQVGVGCSGRTRGRAGDNCYAMSCQRGRAVRLRAASTQCCSPTPCLLLAFHELRLVGV